jgi:hypothetical protein
MSNIMLQSTNEHAMMADQLRGALLSAQQNSERTEELRSRLLISAENQFEVVQLWNESNARSYGAATEIARREAFRINDESFLSHCAPMITNTASDIDHFRLGELALASTNKGRFVHVLGAGFRDPRFPAWWQAPPSPPQPAGLQIRIDSGL